jgi:hypothetical protein
MYATSKNSNFRENLKFIQWLSTQTGIILAESSEDFFVILLYFSKDFLKLLCC